MRKSWAQSSFTESPTTERNAEYIAAESTVGSSIQRGSIGPSMECRLIVKLAEPGFDSATKLAIIEARRRKTAGLSQSKAKQTAGPRGDPVRTPQGPMGTPCGPMETPWGPLRGAMGTHGDTTRTHGGGMGAQSYDTLVFAINCFRIGRTKLTSIYSYRTQCNTALLAEPGGRRVELLSQKQFAVIWGAISQTAVRPHVQVDQPARCSHVN
jgi:hypothetical protein